MKLVVTVVPALALDGVVEALIQAEVTRMTVSEVEVYPPMRLSDDLVQGQSESVGWADPEGVRRTAERRRLRLEVAVNEEFLALTLQALRGVEWREDIWVEVLPLDDVIRIRTGERGRDAI